MDFEAARDRMVDSLRERRRVTNERVLEAMRAVPRHEFIPEHRRGSAYEDRPLPIGRDQTVSAPHMVGVMCELLDLSPDDRVLEIGTGCGYHAAVTAELAGEVYSVEYYESLAAEARERLDRLGYDLAVRVGDGHEGWPEYAPYDAVYLTCAASSVPPKLIDQLAHPGKWLGPVGDHRQRLVMVTIDADGDRTRSEHGGVRFVPMQD